MNKFYTPSLYYFLPMCILKMIRHMYKLHIDAQLTWYGNYDAIAAFPIEDISYEKILMDFTMGCADGGCSHWDYMYRFI